MEDWKEYRLSDLSDLIAGFAFKSKDFTSSGFPVIKIKDIQPPFVNLEGTDKVNISSYNTDKLQKYLIKKGDFLLAMTGATIGKMGRYINEEQAYLNQRVLKFVPKTCVDSKFLYYRLLTQEFQNYVVNHIDSESAQPNISANTIGKYELLVPNIKEQKRIANILSVLDSKIELNRRINGNLEQQVQALYAKAFSSTNTCKMGDVVETTSGGTPSRKNQNYFSSQGIKWIKSKELNGSFIFDSEEHISNDGLCNSSAKLLPPNSTLIAMYGATVGAYGLTIDNATCNQAICALLPNSQYPYTYLYMWAKNNKDELIQKAIGSAQQNISQIIIKNMPVANEKDKIIRFDSDTRYIFSLMKSLAKENYNLIALRDALLPRLMSGELKINDLNR